MLYIAQITQLGGINEEAYERSSVLGVFDDIHKAQRVCCKELDKRIITDEMLEEMQQIWEKYKEIAVYGEYIPTKNNAQYKAEMEKFDFIFEEELLDTEIIAEVLEYTLNEYCEKRKVVWETSHINGNRF